jgi:chorismate mutase/prephenate dehydratase
MAEQRPDADDPAADDLDGWRERIDAIDRELVALLSERARAAQAIGVIKRRAGGPLFVPHRECEVFNRLAALNPGPLTDGNLRAVWREIMSASLVLEGPLTICHFGRSGSFTHHAARLKFGDSVRFTEVESIAGVFAQVEKGLADYGVVPIENSTDGGITDTVDCFLDTSLCIIGELHLRIRHHLMARCPLPAVRRIYSKSTVFGQCRNWLGSHLPGIELVDVASTTVAAERAVAEEGAAAIGNRDAADTFGLDILASDTEDNPNNITRFVILAKRSHAAIATGRDKTSLMFAVKDRPGALYDALLPFRQAGISLSRIESRPNRRQPWEYLFFIDLLAHQDDPGLAAALADLEHTTASLQVLGSYPRSEEPLNP